MKLNFTSNINSIGRFALLKYCAVSAIVIPLLLLFVLLILSPTEEPITSISLRALKLIIEDSVFISLQIIFTLISIWIVGGIVSRQIIYQNRNQYLVGGLAFLILWMILFFTSAISSAVIEAFNLEKASMQKLYFNVTIAKWKNYHFIPFLIAGIIHGMTVGFFLGREIRDKGSNLDESNL